MNKLLSKFARKDDIPSTTELRELILRLERDEAIEASETAQTALWANEKPRPKGFTGFLSANTPPVKRKPKT